MVYCVELDVDIAAAAAPQFKYSWDNIDAFVLYRRVKNEISLYSNFSFFLSYFWPWTRTSPQTSCTLPQIRPMRLAIFAQHVCEERKIHFIGILWAPNRLREVILFSFCVWNHSLMRNSYKKWNEAVKECFNVRVGIVNIFLALVGNLMGNFL